jgi:glycosyltransferase involved in cell wall biosynthesis
MTTSNIDIKRPLITFAVFTFNQEDYIVDAVRAALAQTYTPLEIIISDDCSTDRTFSLIQDFVATYEGQHNVRLNRNVKNLGIGGHTTKMMMELAQGELIVLAAGDDISVPERVEAIYNSWERTGRKAYSILSGYRRMSPEGVHEEEVTFSREEFVKERVSDYLKRNRPMYGPGCVQACHRDVFQVFGPITEAPDIEDNTITIRGKFLGEILLLKEVLVYWRRTGVVSSCKNPNLVWEQEEKYRNQTRKQVLIDLRKMPIKRLEEADQKWRITYIANAGILLSNTNNILERLCGFIMLVPFCTFRQSIFNFRLIHRQLAWLPIRRILKLKNN